MFNKFLKKILKEIKKANKKKNRNKIPIESMLSKHGYSLAEVLCGSDSFIYKSREHKVVFNKNDNHILLIRRGEQMDGFTPEELRSIADVGEYIYGKR